jgi:hypothetical protein
MKTEGNLIIKKGIGVIFSWVKTGKNILYFVNPETTGIKPIDGDIRFDGNKVKFYKNKKWNVLKPNE